MMQHFVELGIPLLVFLIGTGLIVVCALAIILIPNRIDDFLDSLDNVKSSNKGG